MKFRNMLVGPGQFRFAPGYVPQLDFRHDHGVVAFDFLGPSFCEEILDRADEHKAWLKEHGKTKRKGPNSMNKYGTYLSELGLDAWATAVMRRWVQPIAGRYFPDVERMRAQYSFLVDYEVGKQRALAAHVDSSDLTLNVCLGREFEGGEIIFKSKMSGDELEVAHKVGRAILHRGQHKHQARQITSGSRTNLIMWMDDD